MEVVASNYLPGDQRLVDKIVYELKAQGIFDQFRKECFADVDTKPAYQNLRNRVEGSVTGFLKEQSWKPDMNKNQVREMLRKRITESGYLETGVERIVDQVVNPKINTAFLPKVEEVFYSYLGIKQPGKDKDKDKETVSQSDLLPTDLEAVSPESDHGKDESDRNKSVEIENSQDVDETKTDKTEEDESPPFEPLDEQMIIVSHEDNSVDSHLSGFSGLVSHESNQSNENKDSQMSRNSSDSRLSIITSDDNSKMDLCEDSQSKSIKSTDSNHKHKSDSRHKSKSESKSDKDRDRDKKSSSSKDYKSKHNSSSSKDKDRDKERDKDKSRDRRDSKSSSSHKNDKERSEKDKVKDKEKERIRSSSSNGTSSSKHSSNTSKDKSSKKESSKSDKEPSKSEKDRDKDKDKIRSSKDSRPKSSDSKSKEKSSSSSSTSDKHKHSSHSDRHKKDKEKEKDKDKKKESKSKDDHYSSKDKKNDRRSTDRDSNDGQAGKSNPPPPPTSASESNQTSQSHKSSDSNQSAGGNSDPVESTTTKSPVVVSVDNAELSISGGASVQRVKVFKPKFASNMREAMRLMKIRKQLAKLEKQNQLGLASVDLNSPVVRNSSIDLATLTFDGAEGARAKAETSNKAIAEELEDLPLPLPNTVISQDNWDAMEAKLREEVSLEFKNNHLDESGDGDEVMIEVATEVVEQDSKEEEVEEECKYFEPVDLRSIEFIKVVRSFIKRFEYCKQTEKKTTGQKRKIIDSDVRNNNNNNKKIKVAPKKKKINNTKEVVNNGKFALPLSPADSDKSETVTPIKPKRNSISKMSSQRYSSDDLYKPRPVFASSRRRGAKNLDN